MAKRRYDERGTLAYFVKNWQAEVNYSNSVILLPKNAPLSIHACGKLDFLVNHCGWRQGWYVKEKSEVLEVE